MQGAGAVLWSFPGSKTSCHQKGGLVQPECQKPRDIKPSEERTETLTKPQRVKDHISEEEDTFAVPRH